MLTLQIIPCPIVVYFGRLDADLRRSESRAADRRLSHRAAGTIAGLALPHGIHKGARCSSIGYGGQTSWTKLAHLQYARANLIR